MSRLNAKIAKVDFLGRAVIPEGTTEIASWTFDRNQLHLRGMTFLRQIRTEVPEERHWETAGCQRLSVALSADWSLVL